MGHKDLSTMTIYTHVPNRGSGAVRSPADRLVTLGGRDPHPQSHGRPAEIDCKVLRPNPARSGVNESGNLLEIEGVRSEAQFEAGELGRRVPRRLRY